MSAVDQVLDLLRSKLGLGEDPPGSNYNEITEWYNQNVAKIGNGPWCEMTNTWSVWIAGFRDIKSGRAYTVWAAQDALKGANGSSFHYGLDGIQPGDQYYCDWAGGKGDVRKVDHTGTCEKVNADGTIYGLEGNSGDRLVRQHRDGKYIVGYVRLAYPVVVGGPSPAPMIPSKPPRDIPKVKAIQAALEATADGQWGPDTDLRAMTIRTAARMFLGWPSNIPGNFDVRFAQRIINTKDDGIFKQHSIAALRVAVKKLQAALGVGVDGQWGPQTDGTFLTVRLQQLNNY